MTTYVHVHHTKFILFCTIITIHVHAIGGWVKNLIQDGFTHYAAIYIKCMYNVLHCLNAMQLFTQAQFYTHENSRMAELCIHVHAGH